MNCEETKTLLTSYLLRDLDETLTGRVAGHLAECPGCREEAELLKATLTLLDEALASDVGITEQLDEEHRTKIFSAGTKKNGAVLWLLRSHPLLASAAAVMVVFGVFYSLQFNSIERSRSVVSVGAVKQMQLEVPSCKTAAGEIATPERLKRVAPSTKQVDEKETKKVYYRYLPAYANAVREEGKEETTEDLGISLDFYDRDADKDFDVEDERVSPQPEEFAPISVVSGKNRVGGHLAPAPSEQGWHAQRGCSRESYVQELRARSRQDGRAESKDITYAAEEPVADESAFALADKESGKEDLALLKLSASEVAAPPRDVTIQEARFDSVAIVTSPIILKGIAGARNPGSQPEFQSAFAGSSAVFAIPPASDLNVAGRKSDSITSGKTPVVGRLFASRKPGQQGGSIVAGEASAVKVEYIESDSDELAAQSEFGEEEQALVDELLSDGIDGADGLKEADEAGGEERNTAAVNPFVPTSAQRFSTFGIDVDTASYTIARNYLRRGLRPPPATVRTEEFINFFDYDYPPPRKGTFRIYTEIAPSKFGHGLDLLKIGVKGRRAGRENGRRAVLTILVDTSGSMQTRDRIVLAQKALEMMVNHLGDDDLVTMVSYGEQARLLLEAAPVSDRDAIIKVIENLKCSGATNLEAGMRKAYELAARNFVSKAENRVLLLSDGVANLGEGSAAEILRSVEKYRRQGITCSVFGFGASTYDDAMLEKLADKGDGVYAFVDSIQEARRLFVDELTATLLTIARDVKIQVEFNPAEVARYRQLGYENRQLRRQDFRNDRVDAGEIGSGKSVTALYELEPAANSSDTEGGRLIATVRVRYRRDDTGAVEELEKKVYARDILPSFDAASARFRLAAAVAELAEILRNSPYAAGTTMKDVAAVLRPVAFELHLDRNIRELLRLINRTS